MVAEACMPVLGIAALGEEEDVGLDVEGVQNCLELLHLVGLEHAARARLAHRLSPRSDANVMHTQLSKEPALLIIDIGHLDADFHCVTSPDDSILGIA